MNILREMLGMSTACYNGTVKNIGREKA